MRKTNPNNAKPTRVLSNAEVALGWCRAVQSRGFRRPPLLALRLRTFITITALLLSGCSSGRFTAAEDSSRGPIRGGTLRIIGGTDVDHLATTSGYTSSAAWLFRTFTRQLVSYNPSADFSIGSQIAADLAEFVPTAENGGITDDGR